MLFWPEAEDKALRGRNLSAVFRTLYARWGSLGKRLPSCAHTWRVEKQCGKSICPNSSATTICTEGLVAKPSSQSIFFGQRAGLGSLSRAFRTRGATLAFVSLFRSDDIEVHCYRVHLCLITGDQLALVYEGEHRRTSQATFN